MAYGWPAVRAMADPYWGAAVGAWSNQRSTTNTLFTRTRTPSSLTVPNCQLPVAGTRMVPDQRASQFTARTPGAGPDGHQNSMSGSTLETVGGSSNRRLTLR